MLKFWIEHEATFYLSLIKSNSELRGKIGLNLLKKNLVLFQDAAGHTFATRMGYIFVIGKGSKPYISLPKGQGIKLSTAEERDKRLKIA